jgi:SAM-dependent methyltransferase
MSPDQPRRLGYGAVDAHRDPDELIAAMDETGTWDATRRLRSWERAHLGLREGERLLDVGCGTGEAVLALGDDLGPSGEIVGLDLSERMLRVARRTAAAAACRVRFAVGDACALDEPDDSYDAVRSERTLQWLADPARAAAELARVVRRGGRVSLIDSDWSTFTIDVGDARLGAAVRRALAVERHRASNIGGRLPELLSAAGCRPVATTEATQSWESWDPDETAAPSGCFSMESLAEDLVAGGSLDAADEDAFVATITGAAREGRFSMRLTMAATVAVLP